MTDSVCRPPATRHSSCLIAAILLGDRLFDCRLDRDRNHFAGDRRTVVGGLAQKADDMDRLRRVGDVGVPGNTIQFRIPPRHALVVFGRSPLLKKP